jgi:hypothetical protein
VLSADWEAGPVLDGRRALAALYPAKAAVFRFVTRLIVYCGDYKRAHSVAHSVVIDASRGPMTFGCLISSRCSSASPAPTAAPMSDRCLRGDSPRLSRTESQTIAFKLRAGRSGALEWRPQPVLPLRLGPYLITKRKARPLGRAVSRRRHA